MACWEGETTGATWAEQRSQQHPTCKHTLLVLINHCSITDSTRWLYSVCGKRLLKFCLWDSCLCATTRSVKLHIMQIHCVLFMWQYQGTKASGDQGAVASYQERRRRERKRTNSAKELPEEWGKWLSYSVSVFLYFWLSRLQRDARESKHIILRKRFFQPSNLSTSTSLCDTWRDECSCKAIGTDPL